MADKTARTPLDQNPDVVVIDPKSLPSYLFKKDKNGRKLWRKLGIMYTPKIGFYVYKNMANFEARFGKYVAVAEAPAAE